MYSFQYKHGDRPLEGYTIQRAAGRGGFGEVYYALSDSGREVALKAVQGYEQIELRGISQCMNLKSPHLVTIFDVKHNDQGRPFVIMEFVDGPSLRQLLDESPSGLGEQKAAFFLREMAKGLTFLHDCGIVHRDLKPGNIFYENGYVKIGDYGLSKAMSVGPHSGQTVTVGTVHYMAPEVGAGKYDRSIDIYALGACLFEMLTGTVPFVGASPSEILMKHLSSEPDCTCIAEPFAGAIKRAMAKDPAKRFANVQEMVEAVFGAEHVRNSMSVFSAEELSVVAGRVAQKVAAGAATPGSGGPAIGTANSSSVTGGSPAPAGRGADRWERFGERMGAWGEQFGQRMERLGERMGGYADDRGGAMRAPATQRVAVDPMALHQRILLAVFASIVIAFAAAILGLHSPETGVVVGMACWGATLGLCLGSRWTRNWGGQDKSNRLLVVLCGLGGALLFSGGGALLPTSNVMQTWLAVAGAMFLVDVSKTMEPRRKERVSFGSLVGMAFLAWIAAKIFGGSPPLAIAIAAGTSLVVQVLSAWEVSEVTVEESGSAQDARQNVAAEAATPRGAAAPVRAVNVAPVPAPPPPPIIPVPMEPVPLVLPNARRMPTPVRVVSIILFTICLTIALMLLIGAAAGAFEFRGRYNGDPRPNSEEVCASAAGIGLLLGGVFFFARSFKRTMKSWWGDVIKPVLLLLNGEAILITSIILANDNTLRHDDVLPGIFFIVMPSVLFLTFLVIPNPFGGEPRSLDASLASMVSPYRRLWAFLLSLLGVCGVGGIHRFYVGKTGSGIAWLVTFGWCGIGTIVDAVNICLGRFTDASGRRLLRWDDEPLAIDGNSSVAPHPTPVAPQPPFPPASPSAQTLSDQINRHVHGALNAARDGLASMKTIDRGWKDRDRRRAMRQAMRAARWKYAGHGSPALVSAPRSSPGEMIRVATGGIFAVFASLFTLASVLLCIALSLDLAGFLAAGLPEPRVAAQVEQYFGYPEWPSLARKLGTAAMGITLLTGLTLMMFARRRGGFFHMARGAIGTVGMLLSMGPIAKCVENDAMWQEVAPMFQTRRIGMGIEQVLTHFQHNEPWIAAGLFLLSVVILAWPERRVVGKGVQAQVQVSNPAAQAASPATNAKAPKVEAVKGA